MPGGERLPGLLHLHGAYELARGARLEGGAREGVAHPVGDEDAPQPEAVEVVEAAVDLRAGALRQARDLAAAERIGGLHADQHGELPALDHAACLLRAVDEPEPAAARTAALGVHVPLEPAQPRDLQLHRCRLVAGVGPQRLELAERLVLDGLRHDEPLAGLPHPLQPDVVGLLVGVRVVDGPAGERRPTVRVVRAGRRPVAEQVSP